MTMTDDALTTLENSEHERFRAKSQELIVEHLKTAEGARGSGLWAAATEAITAAGGVLVTDFNTALRVAMIQHERANTGQSQTKRTTLDLDDDGDGEGEDPLEL